MSNRTRGASFSSQSSAGESPNASPSPGSQQNSNWVQKDGIVVESDLRIYPASDNTTVDVELANMKGGIILEYNEDIQCAVVSRFSIEHTANRLKNLLFPGNILVAVNGRVVIDDEFEDILAFLSMLQRGQQPRRMRFLNTQKCSLEAYTQRLALNARTKDTFGFSRTVEYLLAEKNAARMQKVLRQQRDLDFVSYLKSIGGVENLKPGGIFKPSRDLKRLVRRGVPIAFRPTVWMHVSLANVHKRSFPLMYYSSLLRRTDGPDSELDANVADDIEKDVDRTFPEHDYFRDLEGEGISGLRRILRAYAIHNPEVGYCQALNFLAGTMLLYLPEENAFWLFVAVVDTLLPHDYFAPSMVGMYVDQMVFSKMIESYLPKIHVVLEREQLQLPLVTIQWFMCCYITTLRHDVALRVWDVFLNEGSKVVFRIACALVKLSEDKILAAKDGGDLFMILRGLGQDVMDADLLLAAAYKPVSAEKNGNMWAKDEHTVSPRLRTRTQSYGQVPLVLAGLGLAHMGPRDAPVVGESCNTSPSPSPSPSENSDMSANDTAGAGSGIANRIRTHSSTSSIGTGTTTSSEKSQSTSDKNTDPTSTASGSADSVFPKTVARPPLLSPQLSGGSYFINEEGEYESVSSPAAHIAEIDSTSMRRMQDARALQSSSSATDKCRWSLLAWGWLTWDPGMRQW